MTRFRGEEKLIKQAQIGFPKGITKITERVYFALGYGASTATLIEGESTCILIDTLNGTTVAKEVLEAFKKITNKPIKTIIYTHYHHFDHTCGAGVFADEDCEIIGRIPAYPQYGKSHLLKDIFAKRTAMQFGTGLSNEEILSLGIAPINDNNGEKSNLSPNKLFSEEKLVLTIDGIELELVAAPGETDDQIFAWLPQEKVLCCGDNYYESWPNLYAIRGGQYRDVSSWVDALTHMISYEAEYLLPGHTRAVVGKEKIKQSLTNYRDAIEYVLVETLKGMNEGMTIDELVEQIKLPQELEKLPYLQEYYGTVEWTVRSIFTGYLGWFDGNPTHLGSMQKMKNAQKTLKLMGGAKKVIEEIEEALKQEEEQWAVELCDILLAAGEEVEIAKELKAQGLVVLARIQTSANARHYYLASAKQLRGQLKPQSMNGASLDLSKKK
ncbi:alkyl/aryl-sulfatase [Niameybacter massiliensis]|uniref:alkyl/aryl-sulfatase n=1 Tax=Niameybacter massiliensis TaxID=1658108 RepID=UPI0006B69693|nr:alkyl/aryl-sulfatase [Niameybacter massiliensis]